MRKGLLTLALLAAVVPSCAASALSFTLSPSTVTSAAGGTIFLQGTLSNNGSRDLFLNDFSVQFNAPGDLYLTADPNYFFDNVPGLLSPGQQYTGGIFELFVANNAPPGTFTGSGTIYGGVDVFAAGSLSTAAFTVRVVAPEPSAAWLSIGGLALLWTARRRLLNR